MKTKKIFWTNIHVGNVVPAAGDEFTHGGTFEMTATDPLLIEFLRISMDPDQQNEDGRFPQMWDSQNWTIVHEDGRTEGIFVPEIDLAAERIWWSPR